MIPGKNCILRLSRYRNILARFKSLGFVKVFSDHLADAVGCTASQVRKDFSLFGIAGRRRGGYNIDLLLEKLSGILGKDSIQNVILVGAGNLGSALLKYKGFGKEDIRITAAFDADPSKQGKMLGIPVFPLQNLAAYVRENGIEIAILAVPAEVAQESSEVLTAAGIRGILNFAPVTLRVGPGVVVNDIDMAIELENVIYYVHALERKGQ